MSRSRVDEALRQLRAGGQLRCNDVEKILRTLGFDVREGDRGGHRIVTHDGLPDFWSTSFDCGHGRNSDVKKPYVRNLARIIEDHRDELK